jgi:hypothetical protein
LNMQARLRVTPSHNLMSENVRKNKNPPVWPLFHSGGHGGGPAYTDTAPA